MPAASCRWQSAYEARRIVLLAGDLAVVCLITRISDQLAGPADFCRYFRGQNPTCGSSRQQEGSRDRDKLPPRAAANVEGAHQRPVAEPIAWAFLTHMLSPLSRESTRSFWAPRVHLPLAPPTLHHRPDHAILPLLPLSPCGKHCCSKGNCGGAAQGFPLVHDDHAALLAISP